MKRHSDFQKIYSRFISQFGRDNGEKFYYSWLDKYNYGEGKEFPKKKGLKEGKEFLCRAIGIEVKELEGCFHVEGLVATSHIDNVNQEDGVYISDRIPKETLESFAEQINTNRDARIMGVHHSEGHPYIPEYFGEADVENAPARVITLTDGEYGLFVDTKLLKDDPKTPEIIDDFHSIQSPWKFYNLT